eukprot:8372909-Prorocentrum_lima.AAC.1
MEMSALCQDQHPFPGLMKMTDSCNIEEPGGDGRRRISNKGRIMWKPPEESEARKNLACRVPRLSLIHI